ncbi:82f8c154-ac9c-4a67-b14f-e693982748a0 [Sclerotinia trifoliorum]|uniref:82f8c154-ac9c-4a67-b14f-e693982748a0 n=1 Tax=Sclerotinia trifoliorum TaxID=28548 RepID=A0A8H2ZM17_9HELO|nr:82f8c154-ac9c-4a67-b14f-e693982748a0 [Sclerotinia trifoliorum]
MSFFLSELKAKASRLSSFQNSNSQEESINERKSKRPGYDVVKTSYTSLPVSIPDDFLKPLENPEESIKVQRIEFENTVLKEYRGAYAVVLDGVLNEEECGMLIRLAEMSKGAHGNLVEGVKVENGVKSVAIDSEEGDVEDGEFQGPLNNGWTPAMVNAGVGYEFLSTEYRNSDRIIWDEKEVVERIWKRVLQAKGIKEDIGVLEGKKWERFTSLGIRRGERWVSINQGINERMRFLRYGPGQYFREHVDSAYGDADGERSFFTIHLYLNDSAQELEKDPNIPKFPKDSKMLRGGATTFHSTDLKERLDVDPKVGRVLIFQHRRLLHSGDEVVAGVKYTMRSDLMFRFEDGLEGKDDVIFG